MDLGFQGRPVPWRCRRASTGISPWILLRLEICGGP